MHCMFGHYSWVIHKYLRCVLASLLRFANQCTRSETIRLAEPPLKQANRKHAEQVLTLLFLWRTWGLPCRLCLWEPIGVSWLKVSLPKGASAHSVISTPHLDKNHVVHAIDDMWCFMSGAC